MESRKMYEDIACRTDGDIYIGVVGPVRTGKSTFIKQFMDSVVIPNIGNVYKKERAKDELPQSASGKTIMTAEPKFVPEEAVELSFDDGMNFKMRLIDCVGYMIPGALGQTENDAPRMVTTPWFDHEISMSEAAEIGTRKVIAEHSTIGLVITTDGTISDFARADYEQAESRVIEELKALKKPFLVVVNSADPNGAAAKAVQKEILEKFGVSSIAINCMTMTADDVSGIIKEVLYEFPVSEIAVNIPPRFRGISQDSEFKDKLFSGLIDKSKNVSRMRDMEKAVADMRQIENVGDAVLRGMDLGRGTAVVDLKIDDSLFYDIIKEQTGIEISSDAELLPLLKDMARIKREYEHFAGALEQVRQVGYSIVEPDLSELTLEQPEIVRQGGQFGVRLRASAPSIHMIRADIQTEVAPIVGTEKQSEDLVKSLLSEFDDAPEKIWESNIFGKSLHELVGEGLNNKLNRMPDDARNKIQETLQRIINEGSGGLICIIL